jgi:hypothetical protein
MKKDLKLALLFPLLVVVLLAAAALPLGALAQDGNPPPTGATPLGSAEPREANSTPTPTPTPTTAAAPTAAQDEAISQPADTGIVVLDSAGEEVPLASMEAAEIIAVGDPIWCPVGHVPGDVECTAAAATITQLITDLAAQSGAGTIYFVSVYATNDATLDHTNASLVNLTDLTIQGGWNGGFGAGFGLSGVTEFSVPLSILNWTGDVTLNDLLFNATGSDGVYVTTSGDIELDNVESKENSGRGAYLDNTSGGAAARVTVSESSFHDNLTGLDIYTYGDISLAYVDTSYNVGVGARIQDARNVTVTNSDFSWNGQQGLDVTNSGDVSLSHMAARHNEGDGAWIVSGGNISIWDGNFDQNDNYGLFAQGTDTTSMLSLSNVDARGNQAEGLYLITDRDVTLAEVNASENGGSGVGVWATWNIQVDYSTFLDNDSHGAYLESQNAYISVVCSEFWDNGGYGLRADLPEVLDLGGVSFSGNGAGTYDVTGGGSAQEHGHPECDPDIVKTPAPTSTPDTRMTMHVVHVVEGQVVTLDCVAYRGTVLVLSSRDQVVLPCPITGQASLAFVQSDELPEALDPGFTFVSGMEARVRPSLDGIMMVDFYLLPGQTDTDLSILRWDETRWTNLRGVRTEEDFFEALSSQDGIFVLVRE